MNGILQHRVAVVFLTCAMFHSVSCRPPEQEPEGEVTGGGAPVVDSARPSLIISDEDIAAWMVTNNEFARSHTDPDDPDSPLDRDYWSGALIQLGHYEHGDVKFKDVLFTMNNGEEVTLAAGEFRWINIVSGSVADRGEPMDAGKHEYQLYPNLVVDEGPCGKAYECKNKDIMCVPCNECDPSKYGPLYAECLRGKTLHSDFRWEDAESAIVTYWQGGYGYTITVMQERHGNSGKRSAYTFSFKNNAKVNVYADREDPADATPIKSWGAGHVNKIELRYVDKGTNHGNHLDPVWPKGGY